MSVWPAYRLVGLLKRTAGQPWIGLLKNIDEQLPSDQPSWVTIALFTVLGAVTVSFWGGLIWLVISALLTA